MLMRHAVKGLSLIELMVAMAVALTVMTAVSAAYLSHLRSNTQITLAVRLNQEVRGLLDLMVNDIRRAGFATSQPHLYPDALRYNPYFAPEVGLTVQDDGRCITYAYNRENIQPEARPSDRLGFRLSAGALLAGKSKTSASSCTEGQWETISDPGLEIVDLRFQLTSYTEPITGGPGSDVPPLCTDASPCAESMAVEVFLEARYRSQPALTQSAAQRVVVRNIRILGATPEH